MRRPFLATLHHLQQKDWPAFKAWGSIRFRCHLVPYHENAKLKAALFRTSTSVWFLRKKTDRPKRVLFEFIPGGEAKDGIFAVAREANGPADPCMDVVVELCHQIDARVLLRLVGIERQAED